MLVALVFVLARNIVKLVVERRRALPFARFRAKLVTVLLGMTLIPAVLVLLVGSELIRNSVDRWFNAPMDEMLSSANAHRRRLLPGAAAARRRRRRSGWRARSSGVDLAATILRAVRDRRRAGRAAGARSISSRSIAWRRRRARPPQVVPVRRRRRADAAARVLARVGRPPRRAHRGQRRRGARWSSSCPSGGELIRTAVPIRSSPQRPGARRA